MSTTREEAIKWLSTFQGRYGLSELEEAINMAIKALEEPQWIPWNSEKFPEESGTYAVTAYDGVTKRVTYVKYQKRLKRWELTGARAYWRVLAWKPLEEPWRGDEE